MSLLLESVKRRLYKNGLYTVKLPKRDTSFWSVQDWVYYIDKNGTWNI